MYKIEQFFCGVDCCLVIVPIYLWYVLFNGSNEACIIHEIILQNVFLLNLLHRFQLSVLLFYFLVVVVGVVVVVYISRESGIVKCFSIWLQGKSL